MLGIFGCIFGRSNELRQSGRYLLITIRNKSYQLPKCRWETYFWYKRFQGCEDVLVEHLSTDVETAIDAKISVFGMKPFHEWLSFNGYTYRREPAASITTSSSLSDKRVMSLPTMFFPWSNRLVDGSFWIRLDTATQAHLRSAGSMLSS